MIRINLLPVKKARKREAGQRHLLFMVTGLLAAGVGVFLVNQMMETELEGIEKDNKQLQADITRLKSELGDYDKVKAQREELLKQQKTINALQAGRTGPVFLMRELSEILTKNKGPTFDHVMWEDKLRRDPNAGWNTSWDSRHAWLDSFDEIQKQVKLKGSAKSNEDVAEFLKRLQASVFFSDVAPEGTAQVATPGGGGIKHVTFSVSANAIY